MIEGLMRRAIMAACHYGSEGRPPNYLAVLAVLMAALMAGLKEKRKLRRPSKGPVHLTA